MSLTMCLDDMQGEQQKLSYYHRNLARQQQQLAQWLQKRCDECRRSQFARCLLVCVVLCPLIQSITGPRLNLCCASLSALTSASLKRSCGRDPLITSKVIV